MLRAATRSGVHAPPARIVHRALVDPAGGAPHPWLDLREGEVEPRILEAEEPTRVVWSSLWPEHPELRTEFRLSDLLGRHGASVGCRLTWTLCVQGSLGSPAEVRRLTRRTAELVEGRLRDVFD